LTPITALPTLTFNNDMSHSKQRTQQHIIDSKAQLLFRKILPSHWVVHEYRPDYGIDYAVEIFKESKRSYNSSSSFETLGEHVFIQLKGCNRISEALLDLYGRYNVEKRVLQINKDDLVGTLKVIPFRIEVTELVTIQRMGASIPVILVLADINSGRCFFVCLNDYIDKVIIPHDEDFTSKQSKTIHIPVANDLSTIEGGDRALRWYGKRSKLFASFQKFLYQYIELTHAENQEEFNRLAKHFADIISRYDFWKDTEMWSVIELLHGNLRRFIKTGSPGLFRVDLQGTKEVTSSTDSEFSEININREEVLRFWSMLANLSRNFEELCREWLLPTPFAYASSYEDIFRSKKSVEATP